MSDRPADTPDDPQLTKTGFGVGPLPAQAARPLPASIGAYRILGLLGEGGMGTVYEAEQASPRRIVALKVVRGGQFVDEHRVRMFQRESEALARLKHPNIGAVDEADKLIRPVVEVAARGLGEDADVTLSAMNTSAMVAGDQGRLEEAEKTYLRLLDLERKKSGTDDAPIVLGTLNNLGQVYLEQGRLKDAERVTGDALARARRVLGNEHKETLNYVNNLAMVERRLGNTAQAEPLYREAYEASRRIFGAETLTTLISMSNLATFYAKTGRCVEQEAFLNRTVELSRKFAPPDTPTLGLALRSLGACLMDRGRPSEAEPVLVEAESLLTRIFGADNPRVTDVRGSLAEVYDKLGRPEKAAEWRRKAEPRPNAAAHP
ncbi:MAG: tetratricopeptide repeat protein [Acidobacteriia bacterium]|nr:tetratricopeptide repeat protein [Terriglobia bacterium]